MRTGRLCASEADAALPAGSYPVADNSPVPSSSEPAQRPGPFSGIRRAIRDTRSKIAIFVEPSPFSHVSGMKNRFECLIKGLRQEGDEVLVVTPDPGAPPEYQGAKVSLHRLTAHSSHLSARTQPQPHSRVQHPCAPRPGQPSKRVTGLLPLRRSSACWGSDCPSTLPPPSSCLLRSQSACSFTSGTFDLT